MRAHLGRTAVLTTVGLLLAGSTPVIVSSTASASTGQAILKIEGATSFIRNRSFTEGYHFAHGPLEVRHGQQVLIDNQTDDVHIIALVAAKNLPNTISEVNHCHLCNDVNNIYFGSTQGPVRQIDKGVATDDDRGAPDADTPDPAVAATTFAGALIEDFDTVSHTNPGGAASTIGDSTLIDANGSFNNGGPTKRTVAVTAQPGTYHFFCTLHPWMQGTMAVS